MSQSVVAITCGKIYHAKLRIPLELQGDQTQARFMTKTRQFEVKIPFSLPKPVDSDLDSMFKTFEEAESAQLKGEKLLENNFRKVKENQIELKSDLLTDIM